MSKNSERVILYQLATYTTRFGKLSPSGKLWERKNNEWEFAANCCLLLPIAYKGGEKPPLI
jgi:hypothetical protein